MTAHPTNDPTNPLHRLADDAMRMANGGFPAKLSDIQGIAEDIDAMLTTLAAQAAELERMREALRQIADGSAPPIPHGHYLAHRRAVDVARQALSVKAG